MYAFLLSRRWLGWLAMALALATVMTLLGFWQLSRYEERTEINARIDGADVANPAPLDTVLAPPDAAAPVGPALPADADWSMLSATGRFDPTNEVLVRARTVEGRVGFEVVTPLVLSDGAALLVDRGWVAPAAGGTAERPDVPPPPGGEVTVTGRIRPGESRARPVERRDGDLHTRQINTEALSDHLPYPLYDAYLLLESPTDPGLLPIPPRYENAWLNGGYAAQWWIFAGMVLVGFGWFARKEANQLAGPAAPAAEPALATETGQPVTPGGGG